MNVAPSAVLFDLDDTISNHMGCVRGGLDGVKVRYRELFDETPIEEMERFYSEILEETHAQLLKGELNKDQARVLRTKRFFAHWGLTIDDAEADSEYLRYRADYDAAAGVVPGTYELIDALESRDIRLGIITNNLVAEQHTKLRELNLFDRFEMLAISEEVGVAKPDPLIFEVALERMNLDRSEVVVIGDSLTSDVAGALSFGIPVVWVDRRNLGRAAAPVGVKAVIATDLSNTDEVLDALLN